MRLLIGCRFDNLEDATAFVPSIWPLEIGNILLVAERKKRIKVPILKS
ncbi:uncharacterized protein Dvar_56000 [Desulfosarcina variabilis str. Montpellier]